jgi:hypothetical protein
MAPEGQDWGCLGFMPRILIRIRFPVATYKGIDGIGLNAITLQDSSIDLGYEASSGGVYEGDSPDYVPGSGYVSPRLIDPTDPIAAATAAGMSQHSTPPATPIMSLRTARTTTIHGGNTAAQNRSLSVPPSETRPAIRQTSDQSGVNTSTRKRDGVV